MGNQPGAPAGGASEEAAQPIPPPPDKPYTLAQIAECRGQAPGVPILIGVKGRVYDVSSAASFYGPGQSYSLFAGHDASRALAKSSLEKEDVENTDVSDLTPRSLTVLDNWVRKYQQKYICVGYIKKEEAAEAPQPTTT